MKTRRLLLTLFTLGTILGIGQTSENPIMISARHDKFSIVPLDPDRDLYPQPYMRLKHLANFDISNMQYSSDYGKTTLVGLDINYIESPDSYLFIVSLENQYIPGSILNKLGYSNAHSNAYNEMGTFKIFINPFGGTENDFRYIKSYPINELCETQITSSFNTSLSFGVSKADGFYINGQLGVSYSQTYIKQEPAISQQNPETDVCSWVYDYAHASDETYHLFATMFYEVKKQTNNFYAIKFESLMSSYEDHWFDWEQEIFEIGPVSRMYSFSL